MAESEILLLDEITANLDAETEPSAAGIEESIREQNSYQYFYIEYRLNRKKIYNNHNINIQK